MQSLFHTLNTVSLQHPASCLVTAVYLYCKRNEKTMKTKSIILAALLSISTFAIAADGPKVAGLAIVPVKGSGTYKVIYRGETSGRVKLNVYNYKSEVVFSETIDANDGFIRPLNFAGLEAGVYTVELIDSKGRRTERINYKGAEASVKAVHIGKIAKEEGKYIVAIASAVGPVTITIYDVDMNVLHTEVKEVINGYAQIYVVKNVPVVTVEVSDNRGVIKSVKF